MIRTRGFISDFNSEEATSAHVDENVTDFEEVDCTLTVWIDR
jgi:hypothetical protein